MAWSSADRRWPDRDAGLCHRRAHPAGRGAGRQSGLARASSDHLRPHQQRPHLVYPNPRAGGTGASENGCWTTSAATRWAGTRLATAENVARKHGIGIAEQHALVLRREAQYADALTDDAAFLRRFMTLPFEVPAAGFRKTSAVLQGDEGVSRSTPEGLAALKPVLEGGSVTYGAQTHPADGNAGIVVTTPERARELARDPASACGCSASAPRAPSWRTCPKRLRRRRSVRWPRPLSIGEMAIVQTHTRSPSTTSCSRASPASTRWR